MTRWALLAALTLPLPFAAMPLVAITLNTSAASLPEEEPVAMEVVVPDADITSDAETESLGFRIDYEGDISCGGMFGYGS